MKQFQIKPVVQCFDSHAEFAKLVDYAATDCIFTVRCLCEKWLKPLNLPSAVLLYEDYGDGEPTDEMIDRVLADFGKLDCDRVIAIGGGSVLDIAKLLAIKPTPGSAVDLFEGKAQPVKDKELILMPTTCGTGSEMTCISIAGIPSKNTKKGLAAAALFADKAVLIPELLYGLPRQVLITSSLDAMTHAMESFVAPKAHAYSEMFSVEAIRLLLKSYNTLLSRDDGSVVQEIADDLLKASNYAGIAFGNVGVGAVHALAYPLGQKCHVFHGEACARFLGAVFHVYRAKNPGGRIHRLTLVLAQALGSSDGQCPWEMMDALLNRLLPEKPLRDYGMVEADVELFADSVFHEQQRLLVNDYVELSRDEIRNIFRRLW
jgi:4-hydroxybutyrate dehydrogenase